MTDEFRQQVEQAEQQSEQPQVEQSQVEQSDPDGAVDLQTTGDDGKPQVRKVVPVSALHESRRKEREARAALEQYQGQLQAMQQQQVALMQAMQARAMAPPVDPQADPLGAMYQGVQRTQGEIQQLRQDQWQRDMRQAQEQQVRQFVSSVTTVEQQFAAKQPDYYDATAYLKQMKFKEYTTAGMSDAEAKSAVERDAIGLSTQCLQRGMDPAATAYQLAKSFGYKPQADAAKKLEMQAQGQRASTPTGGGGQGGGKLSLDALAKLPPKDFLKATEGDKWRELMKNMH